VRQLRLRSRDGDDIKHRACRCEGEPGPYGQTGPHPARSAEICVFEVFGDAIGRAGAAVGMGSHPFRDPALRDDFAALQLPVDMTSFHVYAADRRPGRVDFFVDGDHVRTVEQTPDYPIQTMIGVFDFPMKPSPAVCRCS
jgi:hypothetical protein